MKQFQSKENVKIRPGISHESRGVSLSSHSSVSLQAELELTQPGDVYEQEADRMADRITENAFASASPTPNLPRSVISRTPSGYSSVSVPPSLEAAISSSRGGGFSMPSALRARMESGFGADFSHVRFHTDSSAARMSSSIRANAFTSGNDVFFASGKYDPSSRSGQHLIAHELTHTLQQSGKVARDPSDDPSDAPSTIVNLPMIERVSDRKAREEKEKNDKENLCRLYIFYILTHDPDIKKKGLSKEDAKTVSRHFTESITHQRWAESKALTLEHILNEQGVTSVDTDWLTDFLADEYHIFQADYESALGRAMKTLAERRMAKKYSKQYNSGRVSRNMYDRVIYNDLKRSEIYRQLLVEAEKEKFSPAPYRRYLEEQYAAFRKPALENNMSINEANAIREKEKKEEEEKREKAKQEKEQRENEEYAAFFRYLRRRFFPSLHEEYRDVVRNRVIKFEDLEEAFGFSEDGFDAEDRNTKKILELWEAMMSDLAKKAGGNPNSTRSMADAYDRVWNNAGVEDSDMFKGDERFVEYEKQLLEYAKDKTRNYAEYFVLPDNFVSAETYTRLFFTIMTTALSFIPVGAFAGMGECVAKASHFFVSKVIPKLIDVAVNETYDKDGTNQMDMDLLTQALTLGVDSFFSKLPQACFSKVGKVIENAARDSLQTMANDSSGYLVKFIYGDDVGDWAMVTTQDAMKSFAMSLGKGIVKEAQKTIVFRKDALDAAAIADKACQDFSEGKITQAQFEAELARSNNLTDDMDMTNDFAFQVEEEAVGVVDNTFNISEKIKDSLSSKDTESPVMVVPVYEIMTIDDL